MEIRAVLPLILLMICAIVGFWFFLGTPAVSVANWFWPKTVAPWEEIYAVFYPNRTRPTVSQSQQVGSLEECRIWARAEAARDNDPNFERGRYECGVSRIRRSVYRITVQ